MSRILDQIILLFTSRSDPGVEKFDYKPSQLAAHLQEELASAVVYSMRVKELLLLVEAADQLLATHTIDTRQGQLDVATWRKLYAMQCDPAGHDYEQE